VRRRVNSPAHAGRRDPSNETRNCGKREPVAATILFDLDGTLVDSADDIRAALADAFAALGMDPGERLGTLVDGSSLESIFEREVVDGGADELTRFVAAYRASYARDLTGRTRLFPGVAELLDCLARAEPRVALGVATSKRSDTARAVLDALGIGHRFAVVRGTGGTAVPEKPAPDLLLAVTRELGGAPERSVMVGDTPRDVHAGRRAGMRTIAVTWGMATRADLEAADPHHVIERVEDLLGALCRAR